MMAKLKLFSTFAVLLAGFAGYAPSVLAQDACSCMCTDTGAQWMCSTPFSTEAPQSCAATECPVAEVPAPDVPVPPADEPVVDVSDPVTPPVAGLECSRRNIYRPDLGAYKTYKVCQPTLSEEQKARIAEYRERMQQHWASHSDSRNKNRHHRGGHGD